MPLSEEEKALLDAQFATEPKPEVDVTGVLERASTKNPQRHAEVLDIATRRQLPTSTVENNLDELKQRDVLDAADPSTFGPELTKFFQDADNAALAHDDVDNLKKTESLLSRGKASVARQVQGIGTGVKNIASSLYAGQHDVAAGAYGLLEGGVDILRGMTTDQLISAGLIENDKVLKPIADFFGKARRDTQAFGEYYTPKADNLVERGVYGGIRSFSSNATSMALSVATANPAYSLGLMTAQTGGHALGEGKDQGMQIDDRLVYAVTDAAIEYYTEKNPVTKLIEDLTGDAGFVKSFVSQQVSEGIGEQAATALQDLNAWALLPENKDKPFSAYLAERPNAALETLVSTFVATSVNTGVMHGLKKVMNPVVKETDRNMTDVMDSTDDQEQLDELITLAQSSKLNGGGIATERYKDFLKGAGSDKKLYVPMDVIRDLPNLPASVTAQINDLGGDVEINMDEFMTTMVHDEKLMSVIRPHLTMGLNKYSADELKSGVADEHARSLLERANLNVQQRSELDAYQEQFYNELVATGRVTPKEARSTALMDSAVVATMASRRGLSIQEVIDRKATKVVGPGNFKPVNADNQIMDQQTPEFKNWFGDSKVVDADGKPAQYYVGMPSEMVGEQLRPNSLGLIFTTPDVNEANTFAGSAKGANVVPVHVKASNPFDPFNQKHLDAIGATPEDNLWDSANVENVDTITKIKAAGFDGLYVKDRGSRQEKMNLAVFDSTQVKTSANTPIDQTQMSLSSLKDSLLDETRWLDRGLKLPTGSKIYRGTSDKTGKNTANLGKGLYTTTDSNEASKYGTVTEMSRDSVPQNPLRFRDENSFRAWESNVYKELGLTRMSEFDAQYGTPDNWVRMIDPLVDGIQIGDGKKGTWFVKFPNDPNILNQEDITDLPDDVADDLVVAYKEAGSDDDNFKVARGDNVSLGETIQSVLPIGTTFETDETVLEVAKEEAEARGDPEVVDVIRFDVPFNKQGQVEPEWGFAYVYLDAKKNVWLDVSTLASGSGQGTYFYSKVRDWTDANNGTFVGDPEGLSDDALLRRTEHMVSQIARNKSIASVKPHERQIDPVVKSGWQYKDSPLNKIIPPIPWTDNAKINERNLVKASYRNMLAVMPELKYATYDFKTGNILYKGTPIGIGSEGVAGRTESSVRSQASREGQGTDLLGGNVGSSPVVSPFKHFVQQLREGLLEGSNQKQGTENAKARKVYGSASVKRFILANTAARIASPGERRQLLADDRWARDLTDLDNVKIFYQSEPETRLTKRRDVVKMLANCLAG